MVLSLADTIGASLPVPEVSHAPVPGDPEMPTIGSADHHLGTCRPCAFMLKGCTSGSTCPFCHICDPSEKKRRRKEKLSYLRSLRRQQEEEGGPGVVDSAASVASGIAGLENASAAGHHFLGHSSAMYAGGMPYFPADGSGLGLGGGYGAGLPGADGAYGHPGAYGQWAPTPF